MDQRHLLAVVLRIAVDELVVRVDADFVGLGVNRDRDRAVAIGDDAVICAGSVVSRSVPARAVVMGNPARVVSYDGSFDYVFYDGMDVDPARRASLEKVKSLNVGPA